jgi:aryl-alcohol dehydrogenase-like predicted oxidoreductase
VPLDEGGLTGSITPKTTFPNGDFRNRYFKGDRKQQVFDRIRKLQEAVGESNGTVAEVALRFRLSAPEVSTVIPGMRKMRHAEVNTAVSERGPLPQDVLAKLKEHRWIRSFYDRG